MRRLALALVALIMLRGDMYQDASNAKLPEARLNLDVAAYPPVARDLDSRVHLSNLVGRSVGTACIVGDSTTGYTTGTNGIMDASQWLWGALIEKLQRDNPQVAWNFAGDPGSGNYGIGGAAGSEFTVPVNSTGHAIPAWAGDGSQTWAYYVKTGAATGGKQCDVLFYLFGTNSPTAGIPAGTNVTTFIRANMEEIETWPYKPNIIFVTNKTAHPNHDITPDDANQSAHRAQAAFTRSFAQTNAAGYTTFQQLKSMGFGLVDVGRYYNYSVWGVDDAMQYLQSQPAALKTGAMLATGPIAGTDATTLGTSTSGDYKVRVVLKAAGGTVIGGSGASNLRFGASAFGSNYVEVKINADGTLQPRYSLDGALASAPAQQGSVVSTTPAGDSTLTVAVTGNRIRVWVDGAGACAAGDRIADCGTLALDIVAPRLTTPAAGGLPINFNSGAAPTTPITYDVLAFWEGIAKAATGIATPDTTYGTATGGCNVTAANCQTGNGINHPRSSTVAFDRMLLAAVDMRVPSVEPGRNLIANPAVQVDQQFEGAASTVTSGGTLYCVDQWIGQLASAGGATAACNREADAPDGTQYSLKFTVTASAATAAADYSRITQPLPADMLAKLNYGLATAKTAYLTFWVKASVAGVYSWDIQNVGDTRNFTNGCVVVDTTTWTKCSFRVPGDVTGTWVLTGSARAATLNFYLMAGANHVAATPGVWTAGGGGRYVVPGSVNLTETNGATFQLSRVKLEIGSAPTPFESPSLAADLFEAARYFVKTQPVGTASTQAAGVAGTLCATAASTTAASLGVLWQFPRPMNGLPAITTYNPASATSGWQNITAASAAAASVDPVSGKSASRVFIKSITTGLVVGDDYCIHATANARI